MRTCSDVYHRILHDPSLDLPADVSVGYRDRFRGTMETPMAKFDPATTDIPWHRVLYFRAGSEFIWHKETRLDRVFHSTDADAANLPDAVERRNSDLVEALRNADEDQEKRNNVPGRSRPTNMFSSLSRLSRSPVHRWSTISGSWVAYDSISPRKTLSEKLGVATMNVLHDVYLSDSLRSFRDRRWSAIVKQIVVEKSIALWVLTEVTREFATFLLADPGIRDRFSSSDGPVHDFVTLPRVEKATGQLVLVRSDIIVHGVHYITPELAVTGKRYAFLSLELGNGVPVALAAVHLTAGTSSGGSGSSVSAIEKREKQLSFVLKCLDELCFGANVLAILAGDLNCHEPDEKVLNVLLRGFVEAAPDGLGNTYDPNRNALAAIHSSSPPRRTDRIFAQVVKTKSMKVDVEDHRMFLTEPVAWSDDVSGGIHASDHFGVATSFSLSTVEPRKIWTTETALAFLPDVSTQEEIDEWMRREHDLSFEKWSPHMNMLFPFVSAEMVEKFKIEFADSLLLRGYYHLDAVPESVQLDTLDCFENKKICSVYLTNVQERCWLSDIQEIAQEAAECVAESPYPRRRKMGSSGFVPHLTVARLRTEESAVPSFVENGRSRFADLSSKWNLPIRELSVLQNIDGRMQVVDKIPIRLPVPKSPSVESTLAFVHALARCVYNCEVHVRLVGSSALIRNVSSSRDVDVVITPSSGARVSAQEFAGIARQLVGEDVGVIRFTSGSDHPIVVIKGFEESHKSLSIDIMLGGSMYAEYAVADSAAFVDKLDTVADSIYLTRLLVEVKRWADKKELTGSAHTLFAGVSWSVMVLAMVSTEYFVSAPRDLEGFLRAFFDMYSHFEFAEEAIELNRIVPRTRLPLHRGAACVVILPASRDNANKTATSSSVYALQAELRRGLDVLRQENCMEKWEQYMEIGRIVPENKSCVTIAVDHLTEPEVAEVEGWLRGRMAQFITNDLGSDLSIRPPAKWSQSRNGDSLRLSLSCTVVEDLTSAPREQRMSIVCAASNALRDRFLRWPERPLGAKIVVELHDLER